MSDLLPTTLITRVSGLLATEVDGETVLMHVDQGRYYGLASTAHAIWLLLEAPQTLDQVCAALGRRYSGAAEAIAADTHLFISQMAAEGLVVLT